jgi:alginate export protein
MDRRKTWCIVSLLGALAASGAQAAEDTQSAPFSLADSLAQGRFTLELRPRFNRIDESDKPLLTEGTTVRAIAGWRSAPYRGFRLTVEAIHADHVGARQFNDDGALFASSPYPLLPDPRYTGVNQVFAEYTGAEATRVRIGRQVVRLDDQRWVSDNDFRQVPQLFDGVSVVNSALTRTELSAGYYWRMRDTSGGVEKLRLTLLHASWNPSPGHVLSGYAYFHDQADNGAFTGFANNSYRLTGVRAEGAVPVAGALAIAYLGEAARQGAYAGGDPRIDARYWRLGAGVGDARWTLRYDYEVKGSNDGAYGLQSPLTDFYQFNGWTLHFFNTPPQGLRDRWLTARYALGALTLYGEAHRFRSDFGGLDFGREADFGASYELSHDLVLRLQHARYDPAAGSADFSDRKVWLTATYTY